MKKGAKALTNGGAERVLPALTRLSVRTPPCALCVANALARRERVNRFREFDAIVYDTLHERLGQQNSPGLAERCPTGPIGQVNPAFEEYPALTTLVNNVNASFETQEIFPSLIVFASDNEEGFGAR